MKYAAVEAIALNDAPGACPECHAGTNFMWSGDVRAGELVEICYCLRGCDWAVEIEPDDCPF